MAKATIRVIRRVTLFLLLAVVAAAPVRAAIVIGPDGQPVMGSDGLPLRQTKLEATCGSAIERFCPNLLSTPGQTRNEIICLRPYRTSLPPFCRKAVDAAAK